MEKKGSSPLIHGRHSHARLPDVGVNDFGPAVLTSFTQTDVPETLMGHLVTSVSGHQGNTLSIRDGELEETYIIIIRIS